MDKAVSIIIPTYNHCSDLLVPCMKSILQNTDLSCVEVIIVANGCTDNTIEYLSANICNGWSHTNPIRVVWFDEAIGYTRAINEGIKVAQGKHVVLLNNDCVILEQPLNRWIEMLVEPFEDPKVGVTGPMKIFSKESGRNFIIFFCACISREVINKVGMLDEIFSPGFGEDADLCAKAENAGYKILQVPESSQYYDLGDGVSRMTGGFPIYHKGHESFKGLKDDNAIITRNLAILAERWTKPNLNKALAIDGYITEKELAWLGKEAMKRNVIVEVGSWHGKSTRALGDNTRGTVYAVDHFCGSPAERDTNHASAKQNDGDHTFIEFCHNNFDLIRAGKIIPLRGHSANMSDVLKKNGIKADMIFLDGDHTKEALMTDIECWRDVLTDDGILCGHDIGAWWGVDRAVETMLHYFYIGEGTTIWFCNKNDIRGGTNS